MSSRFGGRITSSERGTTPNEAGGFSRTAWMCCCPKSSVNQASTRASSEAGTSTWWFLRPSATHVAAATAYSCLATAPSVAAWPAGSTQTFGPQTLASLPMPTMNPTTSSPRRATHPDASSPSSSFWISARAAAGVS